MADMLRTANAWLQRQRRKHAASAVTYQVDPSSSVTVPATRGRTQEQLVDGEGAAIQFSATDFIFDVPDLEVNGRRIEPALGHRIIDGGDLDEGAGQYEVLVNPATGKCWAWGDEYHTTYRVHTKRVEDLPAQR